jgi:hypothetical protein
VRESMCLTASHCDLFNGRSSVEKSGSTHEDVQLMENEDGHEKASDGKQIFCNQGLSSISW